MFDSLKEELIPETLLSKIYTAIMVLLWFSWISISIEEFVREGNTDSFYWSLIGWPLLTFYFTPVFQKIVLGSDVKNYKEEVILDSKLSHAGFLVLLFIPFIGPLIALTGVYKNFKRRRKYFDDLKNKKASLINSIENYNFSSYLADKKAKLQNEVQKSDYSRIERLENSFEKLKSKDRKIKKIERIRKISESLGIIEKKDLDLEDLSLEVIEEKIQEETVNRDRWLINNSEETQSFVKKFGKGNFDRREKLRKVLNQEYGFELDSAEIKAIVTQKYDKEAYKEFKQSLEKCNPENEEEILESFVKEYGKGNNEQKKYLKRYTEIENIETRIDIKYNEVNQKEELEEFKKSLKTELDKEPSLILNSEDHLDWEELETMDGLEFESYIADLFEAKDYSAKVTKGAGDQGADIVAEKGLEKVVIQAKRYSGKVSNSAVQEVVASKDHYSADRGIVITNSKFTSSAKELANSNEIELWEGDKLKRQIKRYLN